MLFNDILYILWDVRLLSRPGVHRGHFCAGVNSEWVEIFDRFGALLLLRNVFNFLYSVRDEL